MSDSFHFLFFGEATEVSRTVKPLCPFGSLCRNIVTPSDVVFSQPSLSHPSFNKEK